MGKAIHRLRAALLAEGSFCVSLVSSQLGGVAQGVEDGGGEWMADRSRQGADTKSIFVL